MSDTEISKRLSYVLRHRPDTIGIALDASGWIEVDVLLGALGRHGMTVSRDEVERVVRGNDKQRFAFSEDGQRIRASQGHSVTVELGYAPAEPPAVLYHGTVSRFLPGIEREGLQRGARHHVHLSHEADTATAVGSRRGEAVILVVRAGEMHRDGHRFWRAANGVWLAEAVPPRFIDLPSTEQG